MFEDGTYLETSPLKPGKRRPDPDAPIRHSFLPKATLPQLAAFHRSEIQRIETQQDTHVMEFSAEQYPEVSQYGYRLSDWDLYKQGVRWTPPQPRQDSRNIGNTAELPDAESTESAMAASSR